MLSKYLEGKAQLVEPYGVPGGLIYKDLMAEKSRIRANIRRRGTLGVGAVVRAARRKVNSRQPRSRRQLIESLREMMEAQLVDVGREGPKKGQGHEGHASSRTSVARPELPSRPPNALPSLTTEKVGRSPEKSAQKQFMSADKSSDSKRLKLPPLTPGKSDGSSGGGVVLTKSVDSRSALSMPLIREETEDTGGTQVVDVPASSGGDEAGPAPGSGQRLYVRKEVQAARGGSSSPGGSAKRLPPLAKVTPHHNHVFQENTFVQKKETVSPPCLFKRKTRPAWFIFCKFFSGRANFFFLHYRRRRKGVSTL